MGNTPHDMQNRFEAFKRYNESDLNDLINRTEPYVKRRDNLLGFTMAATALATSPIMIGCLIPELREYMLHQFFAGSFAGSSLIALCSLYNNSGYRKREGEDIDLAKIILEERKKLNSFDPSI